MIVIHGIYRWAPKETAFRNDHCRACVQDTVSIRVRTFNVLHLFWIPLVPLGFRSRWTCMGCGKRPHAAPRTRLGFKIALAILLAILSLLFWLVPPNHPAFLLRAAPQILPVLLLLSLVWIARHKPGPSFRERLARVQEYEGSECLLCGGPLATGGDPACELCQAKHLPLPQPTRHRGERRRHQPGRGGGTAGSGLRADS